MAQRIRADREMLEAALVGLQHRREEIDAKVAELRELIAKQSPEGAGYRAAGRGRTRVLSAAARARIAAAQKKRWEAFRKSRSGRGKAAGAKKRVKAARRTAKKSPSEQSPATAVSTS